MTSSMSSSSSTRRILRPIPTAYNTGRRRRLDREGKRKRAAASGTAFHPDLSPVHLHERFRDRQPQAGAARFLPPRGGDLVKLVEDLLRFLRGYAGTRIGYRDLDPAVSVPRDRHRDFAFGGRELERVADQIHEDLNDLIAVGPGRHPRIRERDIQVYGFVRSERPERLRHVARERSERNARAL